MNSNFIKRVITGFFVLVFILVVSFSPDIVTLMGLLLISNISIIEMNNALTKMKYEGLRGLAVLFNTVFLTIAHFYDKTVVFPIYTIYVFTLFLSLILDSTIEFSNILSNVFISLYITFPYTFLVLLKDNKWILYSFLISASTDTFAYFFGILFGKNKLIERLSPKKTIEGAVGGILGAVIFTYIFNLIFKINIPLAFYLFSILISTISQIGDLFASYIKRKAKIKDYGNILMGHGGIMDRFDSLLLVAPMVYIIIHVTRLI